MLAAPTSLLARWRPPALVLAALACGWLGWHARSLVAEAEHGRALREQAEARRLAEDRAAAIGARAEAALESLRTSNRTLARRAARETTKPDYRAPLPAAGRLLYNAACCGPAPAQPDPPVPPAGPPG